MTRGTRLVFPLIGLALAVSATAVSVRAWLGERALSAGLAAQARGDLSGALGAFAEGAALGSADAAVERARLLLLRRDWLRAEPALRAAMALAPARGLPHLLRAQLESGRPGPWDTRREDGVLGACRTAVLLEPSRPAIWRECAVVALRLAARRRSVWDPARTGAVLDGAAQDSVEAISLQPAGARRTLETLLAAGAEPSFLLDAAASVRSPAALSAAVDLLLASGLWAGAEAEFWAHGESRGALAAHADAAAEALARGKMLPEALAAARRGLAAHPGDAALAARAADLAARLPGEQRLEAIPLFRAALALDPGNHPLRARFAAFLAGRALLADAETEVRSALEGNPRDAESWFLLGEVLRRGGRGEAAREAYARAAALRPGKAAYRRAAAGPPGPD